MVIRTMRVYSEAPKDVERKNSRKAFLSNEHLHRDPSMN